MTSRRSRTSPAAGPLEDEDLLAEILLRLPPKPSSLRRASLACKRWRSIATDVAFRRRFRTHHRKPPILGVFQECASELKFMPLLDPPDRIPSERFSLDLGADQNFSWIVLGCRHGRVLLCNSMESLLLVFEPISGDKHCIMIPPEFIRDGFTITNGAVVCAAGDEQDHLHGECQSSPFKVVLVGTKPQAAVYSSDTRVWRDLVSTMEPCTSRLPRTLVGNSLYWSLYVNGSVDGILQFDLDNQSLTMIDGPPVGGQTQIIRAEDGRPGLAILSYHTFQLWDCNVDSNGVATWLLRKTVDTDEMLGPKANNARIAGYAEDADSVLLLMYEAPDIDLSRQVLVVGPSTQVLVIVHLESMKVEKHRGSFRKNDYHPFTNFCTAGYYC